MISELSETVKTLLESSLNYTWFVFLSVWGGTAYYFNRLKKTGGVFSFVELVREWSISGFSGIVTAYVCRSMEIDFYMTAALAGMAGHMGGRGLFMIETYLKSRWNRTFGAIDSEEVEK